MKDAQRPDSETLINVVSKLKQGEYIIPDFQRDFEWEPSDISALMSSIFRDYYIGSLLLWEGKNESFDALACEPVYGYEGEGKPRYIVLDGQQRLTAMYYAFVAPDCPAPQRRNRFIYFIKVDNFIEENYDDAFVYDWTSRGINLLKDRESQFERNLFPLSIIGGDIFDLPSWMQDYEAYWRRKEEENVGEAAEDAATHALQAKLFRDHMTGILQQYRVAYIEMHRDIGLEKVCDIFTQINSRGVRLDIFDLINALLRPKGLRLRRELWEEASPRLEFIESRRMNVYVLQVMSILRQAYCSPKYLYYLLPGNPRPIRGPDGVIRPEVLVESTDDFRHLWNQSVTSIEDSINLLRHPQEYGAVASRFLPYVAILPAFAALHSATGDLPSEKRLYAQRKFRLWYWSSVFMNRYSGAVESTSARDFMDVTEWFLDDDSEPNLIGEFRENFKELDLRRTTTAGTSIYNGIFNLLVLNGARDWFSGNLPQPDEIDDHHIVPKSWADGRHLLSPIDTILNRSPLTRETNQHIIRDRLPNEYLPELMANAGEEEILIILESHLISRKGVEILRRKPFRNVDYEDFLSERQKTFHSAIEESLINEQLTVPANISDLDNRIETVEIQLRNVIEERLRGDVKKLPGNVIKSVDQRINGTAGKSPHFDIEYHRTLRGRLEFADMRELQSIISNKILWTEFEGIFLHKQEVGDRFQQLAALRNIVRHSRTLNDITRLDGEAALLWFEGALKKYYAPR